MRVRCCGRASSLRCLHRGIRLGHAIAAEQPVDDAVEVTPRTFAIGVVAHDEARPGIELLVLAMARGEFGTEQIPGEAEELHAVERRAGYRRPIDIERLEQLASAEARH